MKYFWENGSVKNELCTCGSAFLDCNFWKRVLQEIQVRGGESSAEKMISLGASFDKAQHLVRVISSGRGRRQRSEFEKYVRNLKILYEAVARVSGCDTVVDSSKFSGYGLMLTSVPGLDVRVVHLVRDSRAVAFSWARKKVRPESPGRMEYMPRLPAARCAAYWIRENLSSELLRGRSIRFIRLRYEDFVSRPQRHLETVGAALALRLDIVNPPRNERAQFDGGEHMLAGNPMRFARGHVELRVDDEWRRAMSRWNQAVVTAMTWPLLFRYGYLNDRNGV